MESLFIKMKKIKPKQSIIVIRGPIGSGKSTTANLLRKHLSNASMVDYDVFKRMIDHTQSSSWRQKMAFNTALFLTEEVIKKGRTVILDIHSAKSYQYLELRKLAEKYKISFRSYLLRPPLETCFQFVAKRQIPDIKYKLNKIKITTYWKQLYKVKNEPVFDSSKMTTRQIVNKILKDLI